MTKSDRVLWGVILLVVALMYIITVLEVYGQEAPRRPSRRIAPGPDSTATPTPTITPTPDPCAACPDPNGFSCMMWPDTCYQCWADCGQPLATPTPTRTPSPTRTPTPRPPTPTPTPNGPPCTLHVAEGENVYLIAFYAHESPVLGQRYTYTTPSMWIPPGFQANPCPCEGYPIGFEWRISRNGELLKTCGDTSPIYPRTPTPVPTAIFSDGFESGTTEKWSASLGGA